MKPLEGIVVLEFSTMVTGSFATMMLAEQGADAIKVEPLELGDPMRFLGTAKGGMAALFANCNRGKRAISIDLKSEAGAQMIRDMIDRVDVVIHNYRPGVMDRLGIGSEALREINPRLVNVAISGFGKDGPLGHAPAYDPIIQARAGFTAAQGGDTFIRNLMCDKITAYTACQAVTAALFERERTGSGQHIDISMLDAGLFFIFPDGFMNHTLLDDDVARQPILADLIYTPIATKDGAITISAGNERQRLGLLRALDLEHLDGDPRFATRELRARNETAYWDLLDGSFTRMTTDEALARLSENDVPSARCHSHDEVLAQDQLAHNKTIEVRDDPRMGRMRVVRSPARFHGEALPAGISAPAHGEHTCAVLADFDFPDERISALLAAGTISVSSATPAG